MASNHTNSIYLAGEIDSANKRYYQALAELIPGMSLPCTPTDLTLFLAAHGLEYFKLKSFRSFGIIILETPRIYSIPKQVLKKFKELVSAGILIYLKHLPDNSLYHYEYEEFSLPPNQIPYLADCIELDNLINSSDSVRFIMSN